MNKTGTSFWVVWFVSIIFIDVQCQQCFLPEDLQQSNWVATGEHAEGTIEFGLRIMTSYDLYIYGTTYSAFTCVRNITSDGIYVFRSDSQFYNPLTGIPERAYLCMRLKKITDNLYTFYILADFVTDKGAEERYYPLTDEQYSDITWTCDLCQVTSPETDDEYSLLTRDGSTDQVPSDYVFMNCPCGAPSTACPPALPTPGQTPKRCHKHGK